MRINKHRRNRHGASSIFLAIILSAVILVECTFLAFVWNLDYALSVNTALKTEIDTVLADYNRQLFDVYGVYAFSLEGIDNECFNKALEINGLSAQSTLYVSGRHKVTTEDLRKAISSYYLYRSTGLVAKTLVNSFSDMFLQLDNSGMLKKIGQFMDSPAADYVSKIIKGSETAEQWINKAGDVLNIDELLEEAANIDSLRKDYADSIRQSGIGIDVDVANWEQFLDCMSGFESFGNTLSDASLGTSTKFMTSHYCAYNFDCIMPPKDDASINGTPFDAIHGTRKADCEYLIAGDNDFFTIFGLHLDLIYILTAGNMLTDFANETYRTTINAISEVISLIIAAVSEGTVQIDYRIIAVGLTFYVGLVQSMKNYYDLTKGERIVFFKYEDMDLLQFSYRDFLFLFCLFTPEDDLLKRSLHVLKRDYGTLYKGVRLEADFRGETYYVEKSYQLYESS